MSRLTIRLFGAPQVEIDDATVALDRSKAVALLAYLAATGKAHTRAALALLLWPENANARTHLRGGIFQLRQALGEHWLVCDLDQLALRRGDDLWVDVATFQRHASALRRHNHAPGELCAACRRAAEEAVALYHGDFLADLTLRDCPEFDLWLVTQREHLRLEAATLLSALADAHAAGHAWDAAIDCARRWLALDPLDEAAHRKLMRLYGWSGRRTLALRQYDEYARILRDELDAPPEEETDALLRAIREGEISAKIATALEAAPPDHQIAPHTNLPASLTRLIGREAEVRAVVDLVRRHDVRLLTLTGPGGVGKSSLSLAVAAALLPHFDDGIFFVSLAPIRDADLIAETIARVLDVRATPQQTYLAALQHALRDRRLLLLLDNFEHVLVAAPIVADLLGACPHLSVLVTSREPLRLYGEREYTVPALRVPAAAASLTAETIAASSAVQLFVQRAQAVRGDFTLEAATMPPVVQICRRLDGLPLAIELAAARMRHFTAPELLRRFGAAYAGNGEAPTKLTILKSDLRNVPDRHRSLWAAIAWSYDLLSQDEQVLFRRLALFVGGWTVEAAQAVCSDGLTLEIEEALWSLLDKQLIHHAEASTETPRFTMLETLREFGLEQLRHTGELLPIQRQMAGYYIGMAEDAATYLVGAESTHYRRLILADYPNLRAVWTWIQVYREADFAVRLCAVLYIFSNSNPREGEQMALATLELAAGFPPSSKLVEVLMAAGYCAWLLGRLDSAEGYMLRALAMDEATGHQAHAGYIGVLRGMLAWRSFDRGDYATARAYFAREGELAGETGDEWRIAMNLINWGILEAKLGVHVRAEEMTNESLRLHRRVGQRWGLSKALADRAELHILRSELDPAAALLAECAGLLQGEDMPDRAGKLNFVSALLALARGDTCQAAALLAKSLEIHTTTNYFYGIEDDVLCTAELALQCRLPAPALCLLGAQAAQLRRIGKVNPPLRQQKLDAQLCEARAQLAPAEADAAWTRGQAMSAEEMTAYARREMLEAIGERGR